MRALANSGVALLRRNVAPRQFRMQRARLVDSDETAQLSRPHGSVGGSGRALPPGEDLTEPVDRDGEHDRVADRLDESDRNLDCPGVEYRPGGAQVVGDLFSQLHPERLDAPRIAVQEQSSDLPYGAPIRADDRPPPQGFIRETHHGAHFPC
jgi:hypothetical protein